MLGCRRVGTALHEEDRHEAIIASRLRVLTSSSRPQLPHVPPGAPFAVQALVQVDEIGGSLRPRVDVGEDALCQFLQARGRLGTRRGPRDGTGVETGRRQLGHEVLRRWPQRVRSSCDGLAHELGLPAGQLDEPVERNTGFRCVPECEGDQVHRAADGLDRDVLTRLRPAQFLHRGEDFTMSLERRGELAFGLRPRIRRPLRCVDARRHRVAADAGSGSATSEAKLPPSFVQRSASASPGIRRSDGLPSDTH